MHDIEDIEDLGRKTQTCPYYGSRKAVRAAEVVTLPYNMLMQKTAREALGLSLKEWVALASPSAASVQLTLSPGRSHIVIVDEAHNLIDSILSLHSVSVTTSQLLTIRQALLTYIQKFRSRFTGLNASYLKQLALLLKGLSAFAEGWSTGGKKEEMVQVAKVFAAGGATALDQINLRKLDEYLQKSKIARKVRLWPPLVSLRTHADGSFASRRLAGTSTASRRRRPLRVRPSSLVDADESSVDRASRFARPSSRARERDPRPAAHPAVHPVARQRQSRRPYPALADDQARRQRRRRGQDRGHAQVHAARAR